MFGIIIGLISGTLLGIFSGLVPGIHSNTIAGLAAALSIPLVSFLGVDGVCALIVSSMIVHTFLDNIPSTIFGVPDADTVLSVLPAHRLYLSGFGERAIRISALGSLWGFIFCLPLFALFMIFLSGLQNYLDWGIGLVILTAACLLIFFSKSPAWASAVFITSGALGVYAMNYSYLSFGFFGIGEILLPLLTGLFAVPLLMSSIKKSPKIKTQKSSPLNLSNSQIYSNGVKGAVAGAIVGWLPGFSSSTANALLAVRRSGNFEKREPENYLISTSAANTANAVLGIAALYAVGRMRSGSMAAMAEFELPSVYLMLLVSALAVLLGYFAVLFASRGCDFFTKLNQRALSIIVFIFLLALTVIFCGGFGLIILILASLIGLVPALVDIPRIFCMGSVMFPVMLFTLGLI
ncbi:MAG: tripartite tricarboxylate transporter permease [Methanocorpusculum sp.]|nr:tripartite tricarboxylate transporter permease [Methanocorpusculum sp.]